MNRLFQGNGSIYGCGHKRISGEYSCKTCFKPVSVDKCIFCEMEFDGRKKYVFCPYDGTTLTKEVSSN